MNSYSSGRRPRRSRGGGRRRGNYERARGPQEPAKTQKKTFWQWVAEFFGNGGEKKRAAAQPRNGAQPSRPARKQTFAFGASGDLPLVGDWNGDGSDDVGVYDPETTTFLLRDSVGNQTSVAFGNPGSWPVAGDWDGDGVETPGVVRNGTWYLRNSNTSGVANVTFGYGNSGDTPVVGDWNGDGTDTPGVVRAGMWFLRNSNSTGNADMGIELFLLKFVPTVDEVQAIRDEIITPLRATARRVETKDTVTV